MPGVGLTLKSPVGLSFTWAQLDSIAVCSSVSQSMVDFPLENRFQMIQMSKNFRMRRASRAKSVSKISVSQSVSLKISQSVSQSVVDLPMENQFQMIQMSKKIRLRRAKSVSQSENISVSQSV